MQRSEGAAIHNGNEYAPALNIDSRAIIHPTAILHENVTIGAFSVIGAEVEIQSGTTVGPHVVIQGPTTIGKNNHIYQFCSIGEAPQILAYRGEPTRLEIGDHNLIREFCTMNRGSKQGSGVTRIGSHNMFMAYAHVAHDCIVGDHVIFGNNAAIAGHVIVDDYAMVGPFTGVHQFCKIGAYSFLGRATKVYQDILPFLIVHGNPGVPYSINKVGLERRGFSAEKILQLRRAYKALYRQGLMLKDALTVLEGMCEHCPEVRLMIDGVLRSKRGISR